MAKTYRFGLIGCGPRQPGHVAALRRIPQAEVVACADFEEDLRHSFALEYEIPRYYASAQEMLDAEELDIVTVVTRPRHDWRILPVRQAAEAGVKAIICEKPFSTNLEEADQMLEICEKNGTILVINHQYRFQKPVVRVKQAIDAGEIGEIEYYRATSHVKIHGQGTHIIDLVRYLHDDAPFMWAMGSVTGTRSFDAKIPGPDGDAAVLAFADDVRVYLECGEQAPHLPGVSSPFYNIYAEAVGTGGRAWVGLDKGYRLWTRDGKYTEEPGDYEAEDLEAQIDFVKELIESIETGKEHRSSARLGRATQEAIVAVIRSAMERRRMEFPVVMPPNYMATVKQIMLGEK